MPGKIFEAIPKIMDEITAIGKDSKNVNQGYSFRSIDTIYNELHGILAKHKVFTVPEILSELHEERTNAKGTTLIYRIYKIKYKFYTDDGSFIEATVMGEGMDSGDKSGNKAMAIAHKYALLQTFCIPTDDLKDPDIESHEVTSRQEVKSSISETVLKRISSLKKEDITGKDCLTKFLPDYNKVKKTEYKLADLNTDIKLTSVMDFIESIPPKI